MSNGILSYRAGDTGTWPRLQGGRTATSTNAWRVGGLGPRSSAFRPRVGLRPSTLAALKRAGLRAPAAEHLVRFTKQLPYRILAPESLVGDVVRDIVFRDA